MLLQVGPRGEGFVTFVTGIGFIARVNALVSDQVAHLRIFIKPVDAYLRERLAATVKLADVRVAFIVHSFVLLQGRVLNEG